MARGSKRGFQNRYDRRFRGGGGGGGGGSGGGRGGGRRGGGRQFSNYKQRGNMRLPSPPHFYPPPQFFGYTPADVRFMREVEARFMSRLPDPPYFRRRRGGMPIRHDIAKGHKFQQRRKDRRSSLPLGKRKSKLMEKDVGIIEYVSKHEGFSGIIKQRFSDFHVHEITPEGTITKLTDLKPPIDVENKKSESEIIEILTPEIMEKLKTLVETKTGVVEIEVTEKSKDDRRKIHEAIKDGFGSEVYSNTEDKEDKKFITIHKTKKGVSQDRRLRWPAERGGVYVHFVLHKENMDTQETVNYLAGKLGVKPNFITYAGTKDRRAVTSQMMSVFKIEPSKLAKLSKDMRAVTLGNYSYKPTCLKLGDLKGNRFRIALRNVTGTDKQIEEAMNNIKEKGFINYYGLQRFGSSSYVPTPKVGRALLLGEWKEAIELILKPRSIEEPTALKQARYMWWFKKDTEAAADILRRNFRNTIESKLLQGLCKHDKEDYVGALQNIPRNTRLLYMHSYQSLVWNNIASRRIKEFGLKPMVGDLVFVNNEDYTEVIDQEGLDMATDEYPKRPRKKSKKEDAAAEDANKESASGTEEECSNAADGSETKEVDGTSKSETDHNSDKDTNNAGDGSAGGTDGKKDEAEDEKKHDSKKERISLKDAEAISEALCEYNTKTPDVRAITEEDLETVKIEDIVLPLPGHNVKYPENEVKKWYEEMLAGDGFTFSDMKKNIRQYSVSGTYRRMLIKPENLSWKTVHYSSPTSTLLRSDLDEMNLVPEPEDDPEGKYKALLLDFCLPSSTYATMALREIIKVDTSSGHQASLNNYGSDSKEVGKSKKDGEGDGAGEGGDSDKKDDSAVKVKQEAELEQEGSSTGVTKRKMDDDDDKQEANGQEESNELTEAKKPKVEEKTSASE